MLNAYGSHGKTMSPKFSSTLMVFLNDMNGVLVIANIRGGGEFGDQWRLAAVKEKKQTSFDDFIACAEYLTQKGITDNKHLVIEGGSSGGMLVTAVANQRPELFGVVISKVPVTNMLRY
jgi:prolyl oligopeptidase